MTGNLHARTTVNLPSLSSRAAVRQRIEDDVAAFLAAGGTIHQVGHTNSLEAALPFSAPLRKSHADTVVAVKKIDQGDAVKDKRRRWTPEREQLLTEKFYADLSLEEIAAQFEVSVSTLKLKVSELGLRRRGRHAPATTPTTPHPQKRLPWTPERLHLLKSNYGVMDTALLAEKLGIAKGTLYCKARELGLRCYRRSA